ncbi:MAG TPA: hypothetical protein PK734_09195 [Bacteroidales bacterium]|nr:MAG: hypothetical protein BWY22_00950 [Bacteroidetes bacterium ADurb.Bin217]HPM13655.1 hypothetical protein [Bacteroidales bacterium]
MEKLKKQQITFQMYHLINSQVIASLAILVLYACAISYDLGAAQQNKYIRI